MDIRIDMQTDDLGYGEDKIRNLAMFALEHEKAPENCELSVSLVTEEEIARLNGEFRHREGPTDVLSFPLDDPWEAGGDEEVGEQILIGDIMIAPEVAARQAPEYGNTYEDEMNLLLVHGCLHLLGYDHIDDDEAEVMESLEREILAAWRGRS